MVLVSEREETVTYQVEFEGGDPETLEAELVVLGEHVEHVIDGVEGFEVTRVAE